MTKYADVLLGIPLHDEADSFAKTEITTDESAVDLLAIGRQMARDVDAAYKNATKDVSDNLKLHRNEKQHLLAVIDKKNKELEKRVKEAFKEGRIDKSFRTKNQIKLAMERVAHVNITDLSLIPGELMEMVPNMEAINALFAASIKDEKVAPPIIPGCELQVGYTVRTTLPNVVEDV